MVTDRQSAIIALAALLLPRATAHGAGEGNPPQLTDIDQVVMYAIDADTHELLRYDFGADEYARIGVVRSPGGIVVPNIESLAMIPRGPHKGLYAVANYHGILSARLVMISVLDATARPAPALIGFENVEGLVAVEDPDTSQWRLIGSAGSPGLISIEPDSGAGSLLLATTNRYRGLTLAPDGTLYGITNNALWTIDRDTGVETEVTEMDLDARYEALEHAFGDSSPRIKVPSSGATVVPDAWTMGGILFGYDVEQRRLVIINPVDGTMVPWATSLPPLHIEGLAFTTTARDIIASIVAGAID